MATINMTTCHLSSCQKEEQCDDCFLVDHLNECAWCEHYDHEPVQDKNGLITVRPAQSDFSAKRLMNNLIWGNQTQFHD